MNELSHTINALNLGRILTTMNNANSTTDNHLTVSNKYSLFRFDLTPYLEIPQNVLFSKFAYYHDQLKQNARKVLIPLTPEQLIAERALVRSKLSNSWTVRRNETPKTEPKTDFELPQNLYLEAVNEVLHRKMYPNITTPNVLFEELIKFIQTKEDKDFKLISSNQGIFEVVIESTRMSRWSAKLIKCRGEYNWNCRGIGDSRTFTCSHIIILQTDGKCFKDLVWKTLMW